MDSVSNTVEKYPYRFHPYLHLLRQEISSPSCGSKPSAPLQIGSRSVLVASGVVACQRESHGQGRVEADGAPALDDVGRG